MIFFFMTVCAHGWTGVRPGTMLGTAEKKVPAVVGKVPVVVDAIEDGDAIAGIIGIVPTVPGKGATLGVGTGAAELTPRLLISEDPNGIPLRAAPPGAVGDVDVGVEDAATLPEPEPHIPDNPDVSSMPEVVDIPDVDEIADDVDVPDIAMAPDVAAVAGAVPTAIPPPS
jgi:hypothetical protein